MNPESKEIFKQICETLNVSEEKILSKSRVRELCEARCLCVYFIKTKNKSISLNTIGKWFNRSGNGSAHAFAIYSINQTRNLRELNNAFKQKFTFCLNALKFFDSTINFNNVSQF